MKADYDRYVKYYRQRHNDEPPSYKEYQDLELILEELFNEMLIAAKEYLSSDFIDELEQVVNQT